MAIFKSLGRIYKMLLKTPPISFKKTLRFPKFVKAIYDEAFSVQLQ